MYTTNSVGLGKGTTGCGQLTTTNSPLGSSITVSPSYQSSYSSLPFAAANKYDGLTLKRQFGTLFDSVAAYAFALTQYNTGSNNTNNSGLTCDTLREHTVNALPDNLFLSSWNEWTAQPQPNPFGSPYAFSMGLPNDPEGGELWVDTFGSSISRDLEPSVEYGTLLYDIVSSCVRVVGAASDLVDSLAQSCDPFNGDKTVSQSRVDAVTTQLHRWFPRGPGIVTACAVAGEVCCAYNDTTDGYASIWPLTLNGGGDGLLTYDVQEVLHLTCTGCGWTQVCNVYGGPTDFCVDPSLVSSPQALSGPFVVHTGGCGAATGPYSPSEGGAGGTPISSAGGGARIPLYRCYDGTRHKLGAAPGCGVGAVTEQVLGCIDTTRSSNMPRALRVCTSRSSGVTRHVLDGVCSAGEEAGGVLGYVH